MSKHAHRPKLRRGGVPLIVSIFAALFLTVTVAVIQVRSQRNPVLVPNLDLGVEARAQPSPFSARLISQQGGINIHLFEEAEASAGFDVVKDEHTVFTCPGGAHALGPQVAHGRPSQFSTIRFWGYEYSGNEVQNLRDGKTGRALWDGQFWLSQREKTDSGGVYDYLDTPGFVMESGKRYYVMVDGTTGGTQAFRVSCLDTDGDTLNNGMEDLNSNGIWNTSSETNFGDADTDDDGISDGIEVVTNPLLADTDGDGIQDGTEQGVTTGVAGHTNAGTFIPDAHPASTTNPAVADTDGDGFNDGAEDLDRNGRVDPPFESDPANAASVPPSLTCGNGLKQGSEQCDDGNTVNGDGCSSSCAIEEGWECTGVAPSTCTYLLPDLVPPSSSSSSIP